MNTMEELLPRKAPAKICPQSLSDYFEVLTKAVFKSGISWGVIEARWGGVSAAFEGFDPTRVAVFTPETVEQLMRDARMVRNRDKIEATVGNAAAIISLEREHGGFRNYLRSLGDFDETVSHLTSRFRCLGDSGAYFFLDSVGEQVPSHEDWVAARR
jgi:3-methyladenine DNA glycosylase Tag